MFWNWNKAQCFVMLKSKSIGRSRSILLLVETYLAYLLASKLFIMEMIFIIIKIHSFIQIVSLCI